jgi:hypothetical protein
MPRPGEPSVEVGTTYLNRLRFEAACWRAVQDQVNHSVYDYGADRAEESAMQEACREYDAALVGPDGCASVGRSGPLFQPTATPADGRLLCGHRWCAVA